MPAVSVNQYGQSWVFGFYDSDAPAIASFKAKNAEITYEPETHVTALDGEGAVDSLVTSKPGKRKWSCRFSGNILVDFDASTLAESFVWLDRRWFIKPIVVPRNAGAMAEVTLEAESFAGIGV